MFRILTLMILAMLAASRWEGMNAQQRSEALRGAHDERSRKAREARIIRADHQEPGTPTRAEGPATAPARPRPDGDPVIVPADPNELRQARGEPELVLTKIGPNTWRYLPVVDDEDAEDAG